MTTMEMILVLLTTPLIATLCYGTWRFHVDPDGSKPIVGRKLPSLRKKQDSVDRDYPTGAKVA